jgi:hypothetical protein
VLAAPERQHVKDETMITTLRWIGSLSSALQAGLDHAVSAELHSITSDICRLQSNGNAKDLACGLAKAAAEENFSQPVPEQIAA